MAVARLHASIRDRLTAHATRYRIVIKGELGARYRPIFDGMTLRPEQGTTVLEGELVDQAELQGLLDRVADLGLDLISVNPITTPDHEEEK